MQHKVKWTLVVKISILEVLKLIKHRFGNDNYPKGCDPTRTYTIPHLTPLCDFCIKQYTYFPHNLIRVQACPYRLHVWFYMVSLVTKKCTVV